MSDNLKQRLNDLKRLDALKNTNLLDTPVEKSFDRLTHLASKILNAPVSLVSLVEPHRQFLKSQFGLSEPLASMRETPISHSFCKHVVTSGEPLIIEDSRTHPLVKNNPAVTEMDVISYLGIPLISVDGWRLGSFCVIDSKPRKWTAGEIETMQTLALSVTTEIQLRMEVVKKENLLDTLHTRNKELDAFAHTVSHNLKNPISAIIGWSSLSQRYSDRISFEELLKTTQDIGDLATHTNDIIEALLLLAGIGRTDNVDIQELNMFNIVEDALARLNYQVGINHVSLNLPDDFHHCYGYRPWVEEVWVNYISNAIKYGGDPPVVTFGSELIHDGQYARFWIKDNGNGLAPEDQANLFVAFSRLPQTATIEGHGLGLSIVHRIIEKLGGEVSVESTPGEGSIFSFTLPNVPPDNNNQD